MTKKVIITISQDGTGNNKTDDSPSGNQSNVAKLHGMVQADYSFDISKNAKNVTNEISKLEGNEGSQEAFDNFIAQKTTSTEDTLHIKLYQDGVGSGPDGFINTVEGGTGLGTADRVKALKDAITAIKTAYGDDVEIELNAIGFSRGAVAVKQLLNELSDQYPNGEIHLNNVMLFDPVASIGVALTDTHLDMELHAPAMADENTNITEFYAANEYRNTFPLTAYQSDNVMRQLFPGAHSQVGGGYSSDILAAGSLAGAMNALSKGENKIEFEEPSVGDAVRMRLYNAIIDSPELIRTLLVDSRITSDNALHPGNESFVFEWDQNHQFDEPTGHRRIINEQESLSDDPLREVVSNAFDTLVSNDTAPSPSYIDTMGKVYLSDISLESIDSQGYQRIILPENMPELSDDLECALHDFAVKVQDLSERMEQARESADNPLTDAEIMSMASREFAEISREFSAEAGDDESADIACNLVKEVAGRFGVTDAIISHEEIERTQAEELAQDRAERAAVLDLMSSETGLQNAIDSGDGWDIAREGAGFVSSLDDYADVFYDDNNSSTEDGFLKESQEAILDGIEHGIGLGQAIDDGDGWEIAQSTTQLLACCLPRDLALMPIRHVRMRGLFE